VLPLEPGAKVAVIGLADANSTIYGGTGSGAVTPSYGLTPLEAISAFAAEHGGSVTFVRILDSTSIDAAVAAAKEADVAVVFVGTTSGEVLYALCTHTTVHILCTHTLYSYSVLILLYSYYCTHTLYSY
jgi:hypothetical protein